jgi:hypothetical protein
MKIVGAYAESKIIEPEESDPQARNLWRFRAHIFYAIYATALIVSISVWFIPVRAPLWLDETGSYWQISAGFSGIWPRQLQAMAFPAYSYILWLSTKLMGTSEIALRIPSILAMLAAVYLLYRAARELFERDLAIIAAVSFCLHPIVIFESIDVRPYAFAVLVTNAAILILLRLRHNNSNWLAALFGLTAACIVWFHYLFGVILPALVLCFIAVKFRHRKALWKQFRIALVVFVLAFLPVIPGLLYVVRTSKSHVFEVAPNLGDLIWTLAPGWPFLIFCGAGFLAFLAFGARWWRSTSYRLESWHILICASLALMPILLLYGVSTGTSIHTFVFRHRLVAIPGIALSSALFLSPFRSRAVRLLFCVVFVAITAYQDYSSPIFKQHFYTWKYALEVAEHHASVDDAPVLICSDLPESDYVDMPMKEAKDSVLFMPLSYYKLSVPVVPLPRALNDEAKRVGSRFLQEAGQKHERFLALAFQPSYKTLDWLAQNAAATHSVRKLGVFDGIEVLEFAPRTTLVR